MANELCLLNLDSGDYINLGAVKKHRGPVSGVGYMGPHSAISSLPLMPSDGDDGSDTPDGLPGYRQSKGHALNAFLAISDGCRLIVIDEATLLGLISRAAKQKIGSEYTDIELLYESFGALEDSEVEGFVYDDEGRETSLGQYFYHRRLQRNPPDMEPPEYPKALEEIDGLYGDILRALSRNIVQKPGPDGKLRWSYTVGQTPITPTIRTA